MSYIYMKKKHKEEISVWGSSFKKSSVKGSSPKESSVRGSKPDGKLPFPLMSKGERFMRCMDRELDAWRERAQRHVSRGSDGHRGSMSNINLVLHQSVAINAKGGDY